MKFSDIVILYIVYSVIARKTFAAFVVILVLCNKIWWLMLILRKITPAKTGVLIFHKQFMTCKNYTVQGFLASVDLLIVT